MLKQKLFIFLSLPFFVAGVFHLLALWYPLNSLPLWRNFLFIFINIAVIIGLIKRPKYFTFFFALLMLQQFYSHGCGVLDAWTLQHKIDWNSILVLITMPLVFIVLLLHPSAKGTGFKSDK